MIILFSILCFVTGLWGIIILGIIISHFKSNRILNIYLIILILFISLRFISFGYFGLDSRIQQTNYQIIPFFSLVFPCVYLYFKNLVDNKNQFQWPQLLHFIIPVLFASLNLAFQHFFSYSKLISYVFFAFIGLYYVSISYIFLKNDLWNRNASIIQVQKHNLLIKNWSIFFFIICTLLILRVLVTIVLDLYLDRYSAGSSYLYVGLLLSWVLYIKILVTPEILYGYNFFIKKVRQQQNLEYVLKEIWVFEKDLAITNIQDLELNKKISTKVSNYIDDIETASLNKHLLRDETGNLGKFADQLEIPKSHLVYIFKYHSKFSFIEFRKTVRILDAVNLIETNYLNLNTLDCLAKKVGFSSYNTFFTSFKEVTGVTPRIFCQEYANKISIKSTLT